MKINKTKYHVCTSDGNTHVFATYSTADYFRKMHIDEVTSFTPVTH